MRSLHRESPRKHRLLVGLSLSALSSATVLGAIGLGGGVASAATETVTFTAHEQLTKDGEYGPWPYGAADAPSAQRYSYWFGSEQECNDVRNAVRADESLSDVVWPTYLLPSDVTDTAEFQSEKSKYYQMYPWYTNSEGVGYRHEEGTCRTISKRMPEGASADDPNSYQVPIAWEFTAAVPSFSIERNDS